MLAYMSSFLEDLMRRERVTKDEVLKLLLVLVTFISPCRPLPSRAELPQRQRKRRERGREAISSQASAWLRTPPARN
jgi:hypothetical protein